MSIWIIYSKDGVELGRAKAMHARTAFLLWHDPSPQSLSSVLASPNPDGSCEITYNGEVYTLVKEPGQV